MCEDKRFEFREVHEGGLVPRVFDSRRQEYMNLFECIDWLNVLNDENEELKQVLVEVLNQYDIKHQWSVRK